MPKPRRNWRLKAYLIEHRAEGCCELCGRYISLSEHHIERKGRKDYAWNLLMLGLCCHNHTQYASGTKLTKTEQFKLAARLNRQHGIHPKLNFGGII